MLSLSQRPLTASYADHRLFVGREEELDQVLQSLRLKLNVYVTGPLGIGRTSFLRQIQRQQPDSFYVRLNTANDVDDALNELSRILSDHDSRYGPPGLREPVQEPDLSEQTAGNPLERLQAIGGLLPSWVQPVVIVDDLTAEVRHQIFGRMRD